MGGQQETSTKKRSAFRIRELQGERLLGESKRAARVEQLPSNSNAYPIPATLLTTVSYNPYFLPIAALSKLSTLGNRKVAKSEERGLLILEDLLAAGM